MIQINEKQQCCGCYACENICPQKSIRLESDEEGFNYPRVDLKTCTNCRLCEKVCPIINVSPEKQIQQKAHLLQLTDSKIRKESTSGGAFTAIAKWIISKGGVVFGVVLDSKTFEVYHTWVEDEASLAKFRNSKYVQSNIKNCYNEVRQLLKEGRWVCFSGTPCQIEGLHHFLRGKQYDKLLLVDVVCYGIPSPGVFKKYMNWKHQIIGGQFTDIYFRDKRLCYSYPSVSVYNVNPEKNYHKGSEQEQFMRSMFSNINLRPSCYDCKFKKRYRISDITIWDCFDVQVFSEKFDNEGTNRVLTHSELGECVLQEIKNWTKQEEYYNIDYFIADESTLVRSVSMNPKRAAFFEDYNKMSIDELMQKWFPITIRVELNTFLRMLAYRLGVYTEMKRIVKRIINKN